MEVIDDTAILSPPLTCVSTWTTWMPAFFIAFIGAISARTSVGAMITAAGFFAVIAFTIGICCGAEKSVGPCTVML